MESRKVVQKCRWGYARLTGASSRSFPIGTYQGMESVEWRIQDVWYEGDTLTYTLTISAMPGNGAGRRNT